MGHAACSAPGPGPHVCPRTSHQPLAGPLPRDRQHGDSGAGPRTLENSPTGPRPPTLTPSNASSHGNPTSPRAPRTPSPGPDASP